MWNDGFVSIMFDWGWLWIPVDNVFYIHPLSPTIAGWPVWLKSVLLPQMQNFICVWVLWLG